ncbi:MAG: hypothetical protein MUF34_15715 [Polyangiaceae bacterium]|nr:hypothetical protein [Polyangiaceae bacterium]
MHGAGGGEGLGAFALELAVLGAALVPEGAALGQIGEAEHLFDAAVAVGGDDEHRARQARAARLDTQHDVVVKLALLPVIDEFVGAAELAHRVEQRAEGHRGGQMVEGRSRHCVCPNRS